MQPSLAFSQCFRLLLLLLVLNIAVFSVVALFASSTALMHIHMYVCMHVHGYVRMYAYVLVFFLLPFGVLFGSAKLRVFCEKEAIKNQNKGTCRMAFDCHIET